MLFFVIHCFALICIAVHFIASQCLLCFALLCFALLCFALLCFALHCIALHCIACFDLHSFALLCFAWHCFALLSFAFLWGTRGPRIPGNPSPESRACSFKINQGRRGHRPGNPRIYSVFRDGVVSTGLWTSAALLFPVGKCARARSPAPRL